MRLILIVRLAREHSDGFCDDLRYSLLEERTETPGQDASATRQATTLGSGVRCVGGEVRHAWVLRDSQDVGVFSPGIEGSGQP